MTKLKQTVEMLSLSRKLAEDEGHVFLAYLIGMAVQEAMEELQRRSNKSVAN